MTPEVYGLIQGCLADKLEDAGYSVDKGGKRRKGNSRPSGLDWSKTLPTSLFYLPCQAQKSGASFFHRLCRGRRRPLQPATWLQNMTFPLQPGFEVVQAEIRQSGVDEVLVQSAKEIWRGSKVQPGRGDAMFFKLALSLRRAGMDFAKSRAPFVPKPSSAEAQGTIVPNTEHHEQSSPIFRLGVLNCRSSFVSQLDKWVSWFVGDLAGGPDSRISSPPQPTAVAPLKARHGSAPQTV